MKNALKAPVRLVEGFVKKDLFDELWNDLEWEKRDDAPRRECWMNDFGEAYTYGRGAGMRTYECRAWNPRVRDIRDAINCELGVILDSCFINGYAGQFEHLGWHADDSPEMDGGRPIAVVSFGATREISFRRKGEKGPRADYRTLTPGGLLIMEAGMQSVWEHSIPKHSAPCKGRISLTYRGLVR